MRSCSFHFNSIRLFTFWNVRLILAAHQTITFICNAYICIFCCAYTYICMTTGLNVFFFHRCCSKKIYQFNSISMLIDVDRTIELITSSIYIIHLFQIERDRVSGFACVSGVVERETLAVREMKEILKESEAK